MTHEGRLENRRSEDVDCSRKSKGLYTSRCYVTESLITMSAYGAIITPNSRKKPLPTTSWTLLPTRNFQNGRPQSIDIHHLTLATARALPGLVEYLHGVFADELERGMTYPQEIYEGEPYTQDMFESYYFAADVLVAVTGHETEEVSERVDGGKVSTDIETARRGREWAECIAGCYYVSLPLGLGCDH